MTSLTYDDQKGILNIQGIQLTKAEVVEFITSYDEEKREEILIEVIELGVKSFKSFLTENYGRLIDNHFSLGISNFDGEVEEKISDINRRLFDPFLENADKKIFEKLTKEFDDRKEKFIRDIDDRKDKIDKEVLGKFMTDFIESSNKLQKEILKFVTEKEVKMGTTLKGKEFEDYIFELSSDAAHAFGDYVEHIGQDDDTGDIMISNDSDSLSICVEAKDRTIKSEPEIKRIFGEIEDTRLVDHSMIVFRSLSQIPQKVGPFRLYGTNRMVLTLSDEDEETKPYLFKIGYRILRSLTKADNDGKQLANVDMVIEKVNQIKVILRRISSMKGNITNFSNTLSSQLDNMKEEIDEIIGNIEADIQAVE